MCINVSCCWVMLIPQGNFKDWLHWTSNKFTKYRCKYYTLLRMQDNTQWQNSVRDILILKMHSGFKILHFLLFHRSQEGERAANVKKRRSSDRNAMWCKPTSKKRRKLTPKKGNSNIAVFLIWKKKPVVTMRRLDREKFPSLMNLHMYLSYDSIPPSGPI